MLVVPITIHGRVMLRKRQDRFQLASDVESRHYGRFTAARLIVGAAVGLCVVAMGRPGGGDALAQTAATPDVVSGVGDPVLRGAPVDAAPFRIAIGAVRTIDLVTEAGSVTVADPNVADVIPAGGTRLIIMGRSTGQTGLLVHDRSGAPLINATIVVTPERDRTVTINRGVEEDTMVCAPNCVSTRPPRAAGGGGGGGEATAPADEAAKGGAEADKPR